ncbi:PAN domain-containing-like protein [Schistosoma japonicum]|uniref:PAN domain-containing-like protein n=1 Tax=Schistosoma japonicum TaxID=6182 RepID=A0A4Z2DAT0_SCHJA|nr:PAN domain-containing-like protein [Schistosoma japonicum]TNN13613.1 PAN domain-containing-like protein [Schistosoma japonicum]
MLLFTKISYIFIIYTFTTYNLFSYTNESFITTDDEVPRNFCQANEFCTKLSTLHKQYFLMGLNYKQWIHDKDYSNKIFWTSIVYLFPDKGSTIHSPIVLHDANPMSKTLKTIQNSSFLNPSMILQFPNKVLQSTLLSNKNSYGIVCELLRNRIQTMSKIIFQPFSKVFQSSFINKIPQLDSCHIQLRVSNLNECLQRCSFTEECRMIYYSESKHVCIQMLYVYALLPTIFSRSSIVWESYVKKII